MMESIPRSTTTPSSLHANRGKKGKKAKQTTADPNRDASLKQLQQERATNSTTSTSSGDNHRVKVKRNNAICEQDHKSSQKIHRESATKQATNIFSKKGSGPQTNDKPRVAQQNDKLTPTIKHTNQQENNKRKLHQKMLETFPPEKLSAFMLKYGLENPQDHAILSGDLFVKQIGSFCYCYLCCKRSRIEDASSIDQHLESKDHIDEYVRLERKVRRTPPKDDSLHAAFGDLLFDSWLDCNSLTEEDREARTFAISDFSDCLHKISSGCKFRIIGSYLTGASLRDSDVNLELLHPNTKLFDGDPRSKDSIHHKLVDPDAPYGKQINNHILHYDLIDNAVLCLHSFMSSEQHQFNVLSNDLLTKVPELALEHIPTGVILKICCYAETGYKLSCLFRNYFYLDERALKLCMLVRHWARTCRIDNSKHGSLSPDALAILVIHFLQRTDPPVLPILHELMNKKNQMKKHDKDNLNDMFSNLSLGSKNNDENLVNNDIQTEAEDIFPDADLQDKEDLADEDDDDDDCICSEFDMTPIENLEWSSKNQQSIRKLFIDFLASTLVAFSRLNEVITIRTLKTVTQQSKHWNAQVKAIENPVKPKINLSRTIGSMQTYSYIFKCFESSFYYLTSLPKPNQRKDSPIDYSGLYLNLRRFDFYATMKEGQLKATKKTDAVAEMIQQDLFARDIETISSLIEHFIVNRKELDSMPSTIFRSFDPKHLMPQDVSGALFCWFCKKQRHTKDQCPERDLTSERVIDLNFSIDRIDERVNLDNGFLRLYTEDMISPEIALTHHEVVLELTEIIKTGLGIDCALTLFGSTVNLLGSSDSDLDICMTLNGNETGRGVDCVEILSNVCALLESVPEAVNLEPILTARVPIIRFVYKDFDIDLCMYNQCAIHNSRLLMTYVMNNFQLAQLYYVVKRFAKACDIADASKGSLSSYAWSLLVIHFMQNTYPPMLPVLQEPSEDQPRTIRGVSGWNVWFNDDTNSWQPSMLMSLTTLFKQFLLYYTNFDFNQRVVSIRTSKVISKFQKNWHNCLIAIEDPFELTYNLSGRLDEQMAVYIMKSFPRAYRHICKIQDSCWNQHDLDPRPTIIKRIFEGSSIMRQPPPYRGCRKCHKIGHRVADCPIRDFKKQPNDNAARQKTNPRSSKKQTRQPDGS